MSTVRRRVLPSNRNTAKPLVRLRWTSARERLADERDRAADQLTIEADLEPLETSMALE